MASKRRRLLGYVDVLVGRTLQIGDPRRETTSKVTAEDIPPGRYPVYAVIVSGQVDAIEVIIEEEGDE